MSERDHPWTLAISCGQGLPSELTDRSLRLIQQGLRMAEFAGTLGAAETDAALSGHQDRPSVAVVHDARHVMVTLEQVRAVYGAVCAALSSPPARCAPTPVAVVGVVEVTDTLKQIDEQRQITDTVPRADYRAGAGLVGFGWHGTRPATLTAQVIHDLVSGGRGELAVPGEVSLLDVTRVADGGGAAAAWRLDPADPHAWAYARAVWASSASATGTSPG